MFQHVRLAHPGHPSLCSCLREAWKKTGEAPGCGAGWACTVFSRPQDCAPCLVNTAVTKTTALAGVQLPVALAVAVAADLRHRGLSSGKAGPQESTLPASGDTDPFTTPLILIRYSASAWSLLRCTGESSPLEAGFPWLSLSRPQDGP